MEKSNWGQIQGTLANCLLAAGIIIMFITASKVKTTLDVAMIFASTITLFYFWWGYIFLAQNGMESRKITDYLYDFVVILLLTNLFYIVGLEIKTNGIIWLSNYLMLFMATILKYVFLLKSELYKDKKIFLRKKIKTDLIASIWITLFIILAVLLKLELTAVWGIFFMELVHIIYAGSFTKFYESV